MGPLNSEIQKQNNCFETIRRSVDSLRSLRTKNRITEISRYTEIRTVRETEKDRVRQMIYKIYIDTRRVRKNKK